MLGDNIKYLRQKMGLTQEELAIRLNVVRQTISKWEKGLSVPDADTLQRLAAELDVSVSELLGADSESANDRNEIAQQLARINEQLAVKNNRTRKVIKAIVITLVCIFAVSLLLDVLSIGLFSVRQDSFVTTTEQSSVTSTAVYCDISDYFSRIG